MKKLFLKITILVVLFLIPKMVFGSVVINEVLYDPLNTDTGKEYIILYNNGDSLYSLNNYYLYAAGKHYIISSLTIDAKKSTVIHWNADGTNTSSKVYTGKTLNNMSNTSGTVALFTGDAENDSSIIVDFIRYHTVGGGEIKTWENAAVKAGIWTAGQFIPDVVERKAIKLKTDGVDNNSPSDWIEAEPSIIQEEPESTTEQSETPSMPTGPNNPPIADAGDNIIGFVNQEIEFDGTQSSDPDNDDLHYEWNMGDGKLIEKPGFTYKYLYPGTYLVTLMVYDGQYYVMDTITVKIQAGQITINEFLPSPEGTDEENEWIEIYNDSDEIVDISDWQLDDAASGSAGFIFPQNTLIAPKSYLVFSRQITGIALNNDKDSVRLLLPEGAVFQEINYEKPMTGKSSAHTAEGFVWATPTPGMANIISPSNASGLINKEFVYQQPVKPETTKEPSEDYVINYQNTNQPEIQGGYVNQTNELALVKPISSDKSPINLVLLILAIIFGSAFVGLLLIKFRRKALTPS